MAEAIRRTEEIISLLEVTMFQKWIARHRGERLQTLIRESEQINSENHSWIGLAYTFGTIITAAPLITLIAMVLDSASHEFNFKTCIVLAIFIMGLIILGTGLSHDRKSKKRQSDWDAANRNHLEDLMKKLIDDVDALRRDKEAILAREHLSPEALQETLFHLARIHNDSATVYRRVSLIHDDVERVLGAANHFKSTRQRFDAALRSAKEGFGLFSEMKRGDFFEKQKP